MGRIFSYSVHKTREEAEKADDLDGGFETCYKIDQHNGHISGGVYSRGELVDEIARLVDLLKHAVNKAGDRIGDDDTGDDDTGEPFDEILDISNAIHAYNKMLREIYYGAFVAICYD